MMLRVSCSCFLRFIEALENVVDSTHEVKNGGRLAFCGSAGTFGLAPCRRKLCSRSSMRLKSSAASLVRYSTNCRIKSHRGSSSSSSSSTTTCWSTGSSSLLLMYMSVEAITINSPARCRSKRFINSTYRRIDQNLHHVDLVDIDLLLAHQ